MPEPPPHPTTRRDVWSAYSAIVVVAIAASIAGLRNDYAYDDLHLVLHNTRVHDLAEWRVLFTSPWWPPPWSLDLYRPVTSLLHALQWAVGDGAPVVFRVGSYLFYVATAMGCYRLALGVLERGPALVAGLLFAAHPVHVEAVALAVGQAELVVALAGIIMTGHYVRRRREGVLRRQDWLLLGLLYVVASLAKEHGLVLPGLLLAAEALLIIPATPWRTRIRHIAPGFLWLTTLGALVLLARSSVLGDVVGSFTAEALEGQSVGGRTLTMLRVVPEWTRLLLWPAHLRSDYSPQEFVASTGWGSLELIGLLLVGGVVAVAWMARRRAPAVTFGIAWIGITLLPVSNILVPTGILLAERTLFLPSVGVVLALCAVAQATRQTREVIPSWLTRSAPTAIIALVALGVVRSAERHRVWRSEAFFAVRSVQDAPRSYRTQRSYGETLFDLGRQDLALDAYASAIDLAPAGHGWRVRNDLARRLRDLGMREREVALLRESLAASPDQEDGRGHLIAALLALGRYEAASTEVLLALERGAPLDVFGGLRALADSALAIGAPPGTVLIRIREGVARPPP